MRTIAILNFKGGVGKTVTTATLACLLAKRKSGYWPLMPIAKAT